VPITNSVSSVTKTGSSGNNALAGEPPPSNSTTPHPSVVVPATEQTLIVSNADVVYHFTSRGGGLKQIDLLEYRAVTRRSVEIKAPTRPASLNTGAPIPIGATAGQGWGPEDQYSLTRSGDIVRAEKTLTNGV